MPIFINEPIMNQAMSTPTPELEAYQSNDEDVVISGISGQFLESNDIEEYTESLLSGRNEEKNLHLNQSMGKQRDQTRCAASDWESAEFIGVDAASKLANMNMEAKKLVECVYDAVFDSGVNPADLVGSQTGVFIGTCENTTDDSQKISFDFSTLRSTGNHQLADQVCSVFKLNGPIEVVENQPCSSLLCLDMAMKAIQSGKCERAVVCGVDRFTVSPLPFNDSEKLRVSCVVVEKRVDCKRLYAKIIDSKIGSNSMELINNIYAEHDINPGYVTYVENYFKNESGPKMDDNKRKLANADRSLPLYIGSSLSQDGMHQMTGLCAIIRMVIAIQRRVLPATPAMPLTCVASKGSTIRNTIANENIKLAGGLMALNAKCQDNKTIYILLQPNTINMSTRLVKDCLLNPQVQRIPHLFTCAARTQQGLEVIMNKAKANPMDLSTQLLLASATCEKRDTKNSEEPLFRGFTILNGNIMSPCIRQAPAEKRPIVGVFTGVLTEWQGICQEMMKVKTFESSIIRSNQWVSKHGVDLVKMLVNSKPGQKKTPLETMVAITAIHIALIDCMTQVGVKADYLIGHSVGELACAYADNCLTAEQAIEIALVRGKCIEEANLPEGAMAIVNLSWERAQEICHAAGVTPSSHNGKSCVTISGPKEKVHRLLEQLKSQGITCHEVDCTGIQLHSEQMRTQVAPEMKRLLNNIITKPIKRSARWISTTYSKKHWISTAAETTASADYFVNSLCSPVFLTEAVSHIPDNAAVIQLGPSMPLCDILKHELPQNAILVPLMDSRSEQQLINFWVELGHLYVQGVSMNPLNLLAPVNMLKKLYPVPVVTGFISDLAKYTYLMNIDAKATQMHKQGLNLPQQQQWRENNQLQNSTNPYSHRMNQNQENKHLHDSKYMNPISTRWGSRDEDSIERDQEQSPYLVLSRQQQWQDKHSQHNEHEREEQGFDSFLVRPQQKQWQNRSHIRSGLNLNQDQDQTMRKVYTIDVNSTRDRYLLGHKINGQCVLPVSGYVYFAWKTLAASMSVNIMEEMPVKLTDIVCHQMVRLSQQRPVRLAVILDTESGEFNIKLNDNTLVCNGQIEVLTNSRQLKTQSKAFQEILVDSNLLQQQPTNKSRVYQMLKQRGHDLSGHFQLITRLSHNNQFGEVEYVNGRWIALLDGMMQMNVLSHRDITMLSEINIGSVIINPDLIMSYLANCESSDLSADMDMEQCDPQRMHDESFEVIEAEPQQQQYAWYGSFQHPLKNFMKKLETQQYRKNWTISGSGTLPVVVNLRTNTITCPGVEIRECVCSTSWTKQQNHADAMGHQNDSSLQFVPYIMSKFDASAMDHDSCCVADQETRSMVNSYLSKCKEMASLILERIRNPMMARQMQQYTSGLGSQTDGMSEDGRLLQLLTRAAKLSASSGQDYLDQVHRLFMDNIAIFKAIQMDQVLWSMPYKCNYRNVLDTVLENVNRGQKRTLKVLEISSSFNHCYGLRFGQIMKENYPNCSVDYEFASVLNNPNEREILSYLNQELPFKINKVKWNILKNRQLNENVPSYLKDFDLVLFNSSLQVLRSHCQSVHDFKSWMDTCVDQVLQRQGFLMVHEFTNNFDSVAELSKLEQVVLGRTLETDHVHQVRSENEWRHLIEMCNLVPVAIKSDSTLSSIMLFRRESFIGLREVKFIDIDRADWKEQCNQALNMGNFKRILLVSENKPTASILNEIQRLRLTCHSKRGGSKLRCVFTTDHVPIKTAFMLDTMEQLAGLNLSEVALDNEQVFKQVLKADLFMNVFKQGKWGSYHVSQKNQDVYEQQAQQRNVSRQRIVNKGQHMKANIKFLMPQQPIKVLNECSSSTATPLIIIHPIEGHVNMLVNLANQLERPVYGVQYTEEAMNCKSIQELAQYYWQLVQSRVGRNKQVDLLGYGFGAVVAMEMLSLKRSQCGSLTLLDSGKRSFKVPAFRDNRKPVDTVENEALFNFATSYLPAANKFQLMGDLMQCGTMQERIRLVVDQLMNESQFEFDPVDLQLAAEACVIKSQLLNEYNPSLPHGGLQQGLIKVVLIKPSDMRTELEDSIVLKMDQPRDALNQLVETYVMGCDARSLLEGHVCEQIAEILNDAGMHKTAVSYERF